MLKELCITNLILMESLTISLRNGFNVISGETGSGKSALTEAILLLMGKRTDPSLIRFGQEKASVVAIFSSPFPQEFISELDTFGIDVTEEDSLIVKREITASGKSRSFINCGQVHLNVLKKTIPLLLGMVGQHAVKDLFQQEHHRRFLDLFADLPNQVKDFQEVFKKCLDLKQEISHLHHAIESKEKRLELLQIELEELQEANILPGEDEALFEDYSRLVNAGILLEKADLILNVLQNDQGSLLTLLSRHKSDLDKMVKLDNRLDEVEKAWKTSFLELQEAARTLEKFCHAQDDDPAKLDKINSRLLVINKIKKKYGDSIGNVRLQEQSISEEMQLYTLEKTKLQELLIEQSKQNEHLEKLAEILSKKRFESAQKLAQAMEKELSYLNMKKASFHVEITQQPLTSYGRDAVEFHLTPNAGEAKIAIRECASGGELSRILFSLHVLLAGKMSIPTLIFDEIDGNIGGITAAIVGKKLAEISQEHQVLCITHFPQVARPADHHIQIAKVEKEGRTFSIASILSGSKRDLELARMIGA